MMDFDQTGGVTLLQFTHFTDDYRAHSYPQCMDTTPSSTYMNDDMIMAVSHSPAPVHPQPPPYCDESSGYANEPNPYSAVQPYSQAVSPAVSLAATSYQDEPIDFESLLNVPVDLGPQPVRIPRVEEEPPRNKESAYASPQNAGWLASPGTHSNPHSPPQDVRHRTLNIEKTRTSAKSSRNRQSSKSPRNMIKRATSPVFPDHSTPLSSVSLSRQPSLTSLSCSSSISEPFSAISVAQSDPGPRVQHDFQQDSAIHSPAMSLQDSPRFIFGSSEASSPQLNNKSSRTCMELEMPQKYVRKIADLDKRILKLQAERAKILEKAHQTNPAGTGPKAVVGRSDVDSWLLNYKDTDIGKVPLYVFPVGIQDLDDPLYEAANSILRHVGGLYFDLKSSIDNLRNICCKGVFILAEISTCFAYIKSLLQENQKLKLSSTVTTGTYRIQLESDSGMGDGTETEYSDGTVPQEFIAALNAANDILRCAQKISSSYSSVQMELQQVRQMASKKAAEFESTCNKYGIGDRERKNQIKSVQDGNVTTLASAERVWPQYYQVATETIRTITECIHPTS